MAMVVWKYELVADDYVWLMMPPGAEPLAVALQGDRVCLWARVDPKAGRVKHRFRIAGTGHPLAADVGRYVGTFHMDKGALVFHVFDAGEEVPPRG